MTVNELRNKYPSFDFYFFRDGKEARAPFLHDEIKSYEANESKRYVFVNLYNGKSHFEVRFKNHTTIEDHVSKTMNEVISSIANSIEFAKYEITEIVRVRD